MKPRNLISAYQGEESIDKIDTEEYNKLMTLKHHEICNLHSFCDVMIQEGCSIGDFDGFFIGYSIPQIGKEFDLLRFGKDFLINIEIKSEITIARKEQKVLEQMQKNYYYLKSLGKEMRIFSYVENDAFYEFNIEKNSLDKIEAKVVAFCLKTKDILDTIDLDKEFSPSNYLISPFNSTPAFMKGEYFLTNAQQEVKEKIINDLLSNEFMFFCISANAGTGKTLLMYDIAKEMTKHGKKNLVIHCGNLNEGHLRIITEYKWDIKPVKEISRNKENINVSEADTIFVDESQRISKPQINALIQAAIDKQVPIVFSFDTKQYLKNNETLDVSEYLQKNYSNVKVTVKNLTNKIRTNKSMASFITNLFEIGKSHDNLNYESVTVDYFNNIQIVREYIKNLQEGGWQFITYTNSRYNPDPYDELASFGGVNAHSVIGQEFPKVVLIMDKNFSYINNKLNFQNSYYSAKGMLYQIVTRVVNELKIIVLDNPLLYVKLLEIKAMDKS